jgi:hypothetical protein
MFNLVWKEYLGLVANNGYPAIRQGNIQQFEMDTYSVCAGQKKCAGFGLSALLSAYFGFAQRCQEKPLPPNTSMQSELDNSRGAGYGGADSNIKYWDANPAATYALLAGLKARTDAFFLAKIDKREYDYCPCDTYQNFHIFITNEVIPPLKAGPVWTGNDWFGTSNRVFIAGPQYLADWTAFGPKMTGQISGLKAWCARACTSGSASGTVSGTTRITRPNRPKRQPKRNLRR